MVPAPRPKLYLWTPIPPAKTGTADYVAALCSEAPGELRERFDVKFVVDSDAEQFDGIPAIGPDRATPEERDLSLYFLANNHHHRYCFRGLVNHREGRAVSLIHDLQCFQNVRSMCLGGGQGFGPRDLPTFIEGELGDRAVEIALAAVECRIDSMLEYTLMAQTQTLRRSQHVIVHSHYARLRLLLEHPGIEPPPIWVMEHPACTGRGAPARLQRPDRFLVGVFGWIHPSKRLTEIAGAFARFLSTLSTQERDRASLRVVGQLPPPDFYDPIEAVRRLGIEERVEFTGYVPPADLQRMIGESHIVFNLRFPSCGETSGTLERARSLGVPVAVTRYAAFHEERADFDCSIDPAHESDDIVSALRTCHTEWKNRGNTYELLRTSARRVPEREHAAAVLARLLLC